jgi:hypothetical protein
MATGNADQRRFDVVEGLRGTFWLVVLAAIVLYVFFGILGAFKIGNALPLTLFVIALAVLWLAHAWVDRRHRYEEGQDPKLRAARQRRGF